MFRRSLEVGNDTCILGYSGRDYVKSYVFDAATLVAAGTNETQTLTITGTPTGGTFTLTYKGEVTAAIAYNATAGAVQTALRALSNIGPSGVVVTGGALPGTPVVIEFTEALGGQDQPLITDDTALLTGGTAPAGAVVQTVAGSDLNKGRYLVSSGLVVMKTADGERVQEWDGGDAADIEGIVDGEFEFLAPALSESRPVPVYNHATVFDKDVVQGYATNSADLETWAATRACVFESQGN